MDNRWQYVLLALFMVAVALVGIVLLVRTHRPGLQPTTDEWDFEDATLESADDMLQEAAATRPRRTWFTAIEGTHVRLTDVPGGATLIELVSNQAAWPAEPGSTLRMRVIRVHRRQPPIREWIVDVVVDDKGEIPLVYSVRTHDVDVPGVTVRTEMRYENLARWAKKINIATLPTQ